MRALSSMTEISEKLSVKVAAKKRNSHTITVYLLDLAAVDFDILIAEEENWRFQLKKIRTGALHLSGRSYVEVDVELEVSARTLTQC